MQNTIETRFFLLKLKMAAPICNFEFFIEISQGMLRTAPGLVRTCEVFENWGNPWQSLESYSYPVKDLESLSCPGKDLSPLECQYGNGFRKIPIFPAR